MAKLSKLIKVNDQLTVNRYDNGWMVEVSGRNKDDEWVTAKVMCSSEDDLVTLVKEYNSMDINE